MRVVAVAEHGDIDHVRRRGILPDFGTDAGEVAADPFLAAIGNEVGKAATAPPLFQPTGCENNGPSTL